MPTEEEELRDLAEMVREGERVLDIQGESYRSLDEKSQQAVGLALATLGGLFALATFVSDAATRGFDAAAWFLISTAAGLNVLALWLFIDAYIGLGPIRGRRAIVPSLSWLEEKARSGTWTLKSHYLSLLQNFPRCYSLNQAVIERAIQRRRWGLLCLFGSLGCAATAFLYVLRTGIGG